MKEPETTRTAGDTKTGTAEVSEPTATDGDAPEAPEVAPVASADADIATGSETIETAGTILPDGGAAEVGAGPAASDELPDALLPSEQDVQATALASTREDNGSTIRDVALAPSPPRVSNVAAASAPATVLPADVAPANRPELPGDTTATASLQPETETVPAAEPAGSPIVAGPPDDLPDSRIAASFPKTLNAVRAESALQTRTPTDGDTANTTRVPQDDPDPAVTPLPDNTPAAPPMPRTVAVELGGVRAEAAPPRLPMSNLPGELAQQIHLMQQEGSKAMRIRLVPEHLGELQIEIHGSGEHLRVRMVSSSPAVRDALESQMGELRTALQKQGISLNSATVDAGAGQRESYGGSGRTPSPPGHTAPDTTRRTTISITPATGVGLAQAPGALNVLA